MTFCNDEKICQKSTNQHRPMKFSGVISTIMTHILCGFYDPTVKIIIVYRGMTFCDDETICQKSTNQRRPMKFSGVISIIMTNILCEFYDPTVKNNHCL